MGRALDRFRRECGKRRGRSGFGSRASRLTYVVGVSAAAGAGIVAIALGAPVWWTILGWHLATVLFAVLSAMIDRHGFAVSVRDRTSRRPPSAPDLPPVVSRPLRLLGLSVSLSAGVAAVVATGGPLWLGFVAFVAVWGMGWTVRLDVDCFRLRRTVLMLLAQGRDEDAAAHVALAESKDVLDPVSYVAIGGHEGFKDWIYGLRGAVEFLRRSGRDDIADRLEHQFPGPGADGPRHPPGV
jgi:hypothetical protein